MELSDADLYVSRAGWDDQSSASQDAGDAARGSGTALRRDLHATFLTNKGDESAGETAATGAFFGGRRSKSAGGGQGGAADASARFVGNSSQTEIRQETKSTDYYPDLTGLDKHEENREASFIHARAENRHGSTLGYARDPFEDADDRDAVASVATSPSTRIRLHRSGSVDISVDSEDHGGDHMSELDMSSLPSFPGSHRPRPLHVSSTSRYIEPYHNAPQQFANYGSDNSHRKAHCHGAASMWPHTRSSGVSGASSTASFPVRSPSRRSSVASSYGATISAWDRVHQADNVPPRSAAVISAMGALQDKIRSLEKSLEQERERNLALRTEAETARQSFEAKAKTMHAENEELASKVRMLEQAKRQACHHAEEYRSKLAEVTASMEAAQAENNALAQRSAEAEGKLAEASAEHARATEEATRAAGDLRAQIDLKDARVKSLQEELVAVDSQKIEAQAAIRNLLLLNEDLMNKLAIAGGGGGAAEDPDAVLSSVLGVKQTKTTTMAKKKKRVKKVLKKKKKTVTPRSATGATPKYQRQALSSGRQQPSTGTVASSVALPVATRKLYSYRDQRPSQQIRISNKTQVGSMSRRPESAVATSHAAGARRLARPSPRHGAPDRDQIQRQGARKSRGWSLDKEVLHANADHPVPFLLGKNAGPSFSVYGRVQEELADPWAYGIPSPRERAGRRAQRDARGFFQDEEEGQQSEDDRYDDEENEDENDNNDEEDEVEDETARKRDEGGRGGIKDRPSESRAVTVGAVEGSVGPPAQQSRARRPPHLILSTAQEAALAHAQGLRPSTPTPPTSPTKRASRRGSGLTDLEASLRGELDTLQRQYQILVTEISGSLPDPGSVAETNSSESFQQTGLRKSRDLTEVVEKIEIKTQQLAALEGLRRSAAVSPRPRSPVRSPEAFDRKVQALRTLQHFREEPPYL